MLMFVLSNDDHAGTFIFLRSDKPAGMRSGEEDGQGITVDKPPSHRRLCVFEKASCVT